MRNSRFISSKTNTRGVTLLETVVAIAIFSVVALVVSLFAKDIFVFSGGVQNRMAAEQSARNVLRDFASEVRAMLPSNNGSYPIEIAEANEFVFYSDVDGDGGSERVRYYISGGDVKKDVIEPSGTPATYIGTPRTKTMVNNIANGGTALFSYYDSAYGGTTPPLSDPVSVAVIRLIKVSIVIDADPNRDPPPISVTTQVSVRNLKDNL